MTEEVHPFTTDDSVAYHDGELPADRRAAFEAHLAGCAECRRTMDATEVALGALDARLTEPPPLDVEEALAAIRRGEAEARAARTRRRTAWTIAGSVGLAAVAGAVLLAVRPEDLATPSFVAAIHPLAFAPAPPDWKPPPPFRVPAAAVSARVRRPFLRHGAPAVEIAVAREAGDRYALVVLIDSHRRIWRLRSGEAPDAACGKNCGPLRLETDLTALAPGRVEVIAAVGPRPIDEAAFERAMEEDATQTPKAQERALGRTTVARP